MSEERLKDELTRKFFSGPKWDTNKEINDLPLFAALVVASRCARRLIPHFNPHESDRPVARTKRQVFFDAIVAAETIASGKQPGEPLDSLRYLAGRLAANDRHFHVVKHLTQAALHVSKGDGERARISVFECIPTADDLLEIATGKGMYDLIAADVKKLAAMDLGQYPDNGKPDDTALLGDP